MTFTIELKNREFKQSQYFGGVMAVDVKRYFVGSDEFVSLQYRNQDKDSFMHDFHEFTIDELLVTNDDNGCMHRWKRGTDGKFGSAEVDLRMALGTARPMSTKAAT